MATLQKEGLLIGKDQDGNTVLIYPITTMDNVDGLSEALAESKPVIQLSTLLAAGWDIDSKTYSFEQDYPSAQYVLAVEPDSSCTDDQMEAWNAAAITGSAASNTVKSYGDVPSVDIPIILEVRAK